MATAPHEVLTAVTPAPVLPVLELCAALYPARLYRKGMVLQLAGGDSTAFLDGEGRAIAVLGFYPSQPERRGETLLELWFVIRPDAGGLIRPLARLARLTLDRLADTDGLRIRARIAEGHKPGRSLARIVGLARNGGAEGHEHWEWTADGRTRKGSRQGAGAQQERRDGGRRGAATAAPADQSGAADVDAAERGT